MTDPNSRLVYSTATGIIKESEAATSASPFPCLIRGHREHLFGDMVDTYN